MAPSRNRVLGSSETALHDIARAVRSRTSISTLPGEVPRIEDTFADGNVVQEGATPAWASDLDVVGVVDGAKLPD